MPRIILFITATPIVSLDKDYSTVDRVLKNVHYPNEYEIFYSGQDRGRMDHLLLEAIQMGWEIGVCHRKKENESFLYLGSTTICNIVHYRTVPIGQRSQDFERLQIHLVLQNVRNHSIPQMHHIQASGRYKKDAFAYLNMPQNLNYNLGFYKIV